MGRGAETSSHSCQQHEAVIVDGEGGPGAGEEKEKDEYSDLPEVLNENAWETLVRRRHLLQVWHFSPYRLTLDQAKGAKVMAEKKGQLEACSTIVQEYFPEELFTKETTAKSEEIRNISLSVHESGDLSEDVHHHKDTRERIAQLEEEEMRSLGGGNLHNLNVIKEEEDGHDAMVMDGDVPKLNLSKMATSASGGNKSAHGQGQGHLHIKQEPQDHLNHHNHDLNGRLGKRGGGVGGGVGGPGVSPGGRSNDGDVNQPGETNKIDADEEDNHQMEDEDFYDEEELFPNEFDDDDGYNDPYDDDKGNGESYYT